MNACPTHVMPMPVALTLKVLLFVNVTQAILETDLIVLVIMNVCPVLVMLMPAVLTQKAPLFVNAAGGFLEMALIVLVSNSIIRLILYRLLLFH